MSLEDDTINSDDTTGYFTAQKGFVERSLLHNASIRGIINSAGAFSSDKIEKKVLSISGVFISSINSRTACWNAKYK